MFFSAEFDPVRLTGQIILLQSSFYLIMCIILLLLHMIFSTPLHCALLLSSRAITATNQWGGTIVLILTSLFVPFLLQRIVMRTKLCLDFTFTLYFLHIIITILYDSLYITKQLFYWVLYIIIIITTTILSEYLCTQMELSDIPLGFLSAIDLPNNKVDKGKNNNNNNNKIKKDDKFKITSLPDDTNPAAAAATQRTTLTDLANSTSYIDNDTNIGVNQRINNSNTPQSLSRQHSHQQKTRFNNTNNHSGGSESDYDDDDTDMDDNNMEKIPLKPYR